MNATLQAQNAYRKKSRSIKTDRDTEYDAFAQITSRMKSAAARGPSGFKALAAALYDNRRLWTILVTDIASKSNRLPPDLQARIVYLAEFSRLHSTKVLRKEATVDALIEVNTAIMKGLRQSSTAVTRKAAPQPVHEGG